MASIQSADHVRGRDAPPVIVVEGTPAAFAAALREVERAGWRLVEGFDGLPAGPRIVRVGQIERSEDAAAALLAVLAGAGLVAHAVADRRVLDPLLEDLRHAGRVDHRRERDAPDEPPDPDALAILSMLAEGRTLGEAAAALGLSRRTADRRLAAARTALGVERTVEAVAKARRLRWLG